MLLEHPAVARGRRLAQPRVAPGVLVVAQVDAGVVADEPGEQRHVEHAAERAAPASRCSRCTRRPRAVVRSGAGCRRAATRAGPGFLSRTNSSSRGKTPRCSRSRSSSRVSAPAVVGRALAAEHEVREVRCDARARCGRSPDGCAARTRTRSGARRGRAGRRRSPRRPHGRARRGRDRQALEPDVEADVALEVRGPRRGGASRAAGRSGGSAGRATAGPWERRHQRAARRRTPRARSRTAGRRTRRRSRGRSRAWRSPGGSRCSGGRGRSSRGRRIELLHEPGAEQRPWRAPRAGGGCPGAAAGPAIQSARRGLAVVVLAREEAGHALAECVDGGARRRVGEPRGLEHDAIGQELEVRRRASRSAPRAVGSKRSSRAPTRIGTSAWTRRRARGARRRAPRGSRGGQRSASTGEARARLRPARAGAAASAPPRRRSARRAPAPSARSRSAPRAACGRPRRGSGGAPGPQRALEGVGQARRVARLREEARDALLDELRNPGEARGDDRQPARHRLEDHRRQHVAGALGVDDRREREDVARRSRRFTSSCVRSPASSTDALEIVLPDAFLERARATAPRRRSCRRTRARGGGARRRRRSGGWKPLNSISLPTRRRCARAARSAKAAWSGNSAGSTPL